MATKVAFISLNNGSIKEQSFQYVFNPGFAPVQKQKNITSLHDSIQKEFPKFNVLEISSKSTVEIGKRLSAFNLTLDNKCVESIFQSSKVFANGEQFDFLLDKSGREAKKYIKEHAQGQLKCFKYQGIEYPLFPKTAFYDYIYIKALLNNKGIYEELTKYDIFTDIEFNEKKSINCQARTCAIFVSLFRSKKIDNAMKSFDSFIEIYRDINNGQLELELN